MFGGNRTTSRDIKSTDCLLRKNEGKGDLKTMLLSVDSRHRDRKELTTPSNYTYTITEPIQSVKKVLLVTTEIPNSQTVIHGGNNVFQFRDTSVTPSIDYEFEIPHGSYNGYQLASVIEVGMDTAISASFEVFKVAYSMPESSIVIQRVASDSQVNHSFTILFGSGSQANPALILGMEKVDLIAGIIPESPLDISRQVKSTKSLQLQGHDYMIMSANGLAAVKGFENPCDVLAKIVLRSSPGTMIFNGHKSKELTFDRVMPWMKKLVIRFFNPDGSDVDFRGVDHSFTLKLTYFG